MSEPVRIIHCAMDEDDDKNIVFRGVIDPSYLHLCNLDYAALGGYQREQLSEYDITKMASDWLAGDKFPDIVVGMRGERYLEKDDATWLLDPLYLIDGQQRRASALRAAMSEPNFRPRVGAIVHFNTNRETERRLFTRLNTRGKKLAPGVLLQGMRETNDAINTLFILTMDRSFALHNGVRWDQIRRTEHLVSAVTYLGTTLRLHYHASPLGRVHNEVLRVAEYLRRTSIAIGHSRLRDNTRQFFEVIEAAWGIRGYTKFNSPPWMRTNMLMALADVFSRNLDFWDARDPNRLQVSAGDIRKLSNFDMGNPNIIALASGGSQAQRSLTLEFEEHLNSGRRQGNRLTRRVERGSPKPQEDAA